MNNENSNEEIDLMQVLDMIKNAFRKFLKGILSIISFYKKKVILFLILLIIGGVLGYFVDQTLNDKNYYIQEIIIEPKFNSTKYVYDFVEELEANFKDDTFLKKLGINPEDIKLLREITLEPVIKGTDVLDNLQDRYENKEFFKDIMEAYDEGQVEEEKFRDFYKHHKLRLVFEDNTKEMEKITDSILRYLKSNPYYNEVINLTLIQDKASFEQNKKTLSFINEYLTNLGKNPQKAQNEIVVYNNIPNEVPTVTIASLLQQKEKLMEIINEQERSLKFDKDIFGIVDYGDIISKRKQLFNRTLFLIPITLIGIVSFFYLLGYISKRVNNFVKEEE